MIKHKDHFHGSDLEKIEKIYGIKKEDIVSFSANVNPLGVAPSVKEALSNNIDAITSYPDREYTSLRNAMASYCGCSADNIVVGNGSTELISLFIKAVNPTKALILGPTYSEYEHEISLNNGTTKYYPLKEELDFNLDVADFINSLNDSIDLLVICNPNNPTSTSITNKDMRKILDACLVNDITVLVDETYVEFTEDIKAITSVGLTAAYDNIVVLRGTSKFFASPGLRLGYAVCGSADLLKAVKSKQDPWAINSLAVIAGIAMFSDKEYQRAAHDLIISERNRMYDLFVKSSRFKPYKPTGNFMLLQILDDNITSQDLFDECIKKGMMIRDCSTFPFLNEKYIRFCFMNPEDNDKLAAVLLGE